MPSKWSSSSADYLTPRAPGASDAWSATSPGRTAQRLALVGEVAAPSAVAEALELPAGAHVYVRQRLIELDGETIEIASSYYPATVAEGTTLASPKKLKGGAVAELVRLGYQPTHVTEDVDLRSATAGEAAVLGVDLGTNILALLRTAYAHATPYEASLMVMRGPRRLHYELEVTP